MANNQSALLALLGVLQQAEGGDVMRQLLGSALQDLIEAEAAAHIGAAKHERTPERTAQRNGTRQKLVSTTAGDITVKIPKTRTGSFFPSLLQPRRRVDRALHVVICAAYVHEVSTRNVDDLVTALCVESGISKSEVSRICAALDEEVAAWRERPLDHTWFPYVFLDATFCKVRIGGRVVSQAIVVATGVSIDGRREILGHRVGDSETGAFWTEFLRSPPGRRGQLEPRAAAAWQAPAWPGRPVARHRGSRQSPPLLAAARQGRSRRSYPGRHGSGAGCTSCATYWPRSPAATPRSAPPRSA